MDPEKVDPPADELTDGDLEQVSGGVTGPAAPAAPGKWDSKTIPGQTQSTVVNGLNPGGEYDVQVFAKDAQTKVVGPKSNPTTVKLP